MGFVGLLDDLKHRRLNASRKRLPRLTTLNGLKRHFILIHLNPPYHIINEVTIVFKIASVGVPSTAIGSSSLLEQKL